MDEKPKYWKELTDTEKIERMRDELKSTQRQLGVAVQLNEKLLHIVYEHHHVADKVMLPAVRHNVYGENNCLSTKQANPDEVFF